VKYAVVFEKTNTGWSAYVPDLPGVGVAAGTLDETRALTVEAIEFHVEGLREDGDPIPEPTARVEELETSIA
jgi:predicted RNase H-like HicB family nuclease